MRIAQVAPLIESVPPKLYGGTERVVAYLVDELVRLGHHVTLFASGDSCTRAQLVPGAPCALRLAGCQDALAPHIVMLEEVLRRASDFDVIHFHTGHLHFPLARRHLRTHVTTLHGRLDLPELRPLHAEFDDIPCVSISDAQRTPLPDAHWLATVHHGLPLDLLPFSATDNGYLAFLGRASPEKRLDRAIAIARACRMPLKDAAKIDPADAVYFEREIRPLLDDPCVEFIGEIGEQQKGAFLGGAKALLFPIDWPEPFGLVMIEALACGTPVVAFRGGSVEEVLDEGVTGFIVDTVDDAIAAVEGVDRLERRACRRTFEDRFSVHRMTEDYLQLYERLLAQPCGAESMAERPCSTSFA